MTNSTTERPNVPAEILGVTWTRTRRTKVTALTASNSAALAVAVEEAGLVLAHLGKTTATFYGSPSEAWKMMDRAGGTLGNKYGRRGHPVASIHAVLRKLKTEATLRP